MRRLLTSGCGDMALRLGTRRARTFTDSSIHVPAAVTKRVGVEAGVSLGWYRWVGLGGTTVTLDRFGASAPGDRVMKELGFTAEHVAQKAEALVR